MFKIRKVHVFEYCISSYICEIEIFINKTFFNLLIGEYKGFDEEELTSESGGKGLVIQNLKDTYGYKNVVMIGDGATDLETCPPAVILFFCLIIGIK